VSSKTNASARQRPSKACNWSSPHARVSFFAFRIVLLFVVVFRLATSGKTWSQPASDEYRVKAAFLFHFAQLVEWPADAFDGDGSPLVLCTLEDDAFYDELENTVQGKQIGSRTIRVRHVHLAQAARGCNLLFIGRSDSKNLSLSALRNLPVLTVGETDDFLSSGGMIRFRFEQDKIRFDINGAAADSSHLKISSRLLLLATSVTRSGAMEQGR
jgi:hypothetical protein